MTRTALMVICCFIFSFNSILAQDEIVETIDQAKELYLQQSFQEAAEQLTKALRLLNDKLLDKLKSAFPTPLGGWRANDAEGSVTQSSSFIGLLAKRSYFKEGGGSSVDIKLETNSIRIGNIKMLISSPAMLKRAGDNLAIGDVADRKCLERFDRIDRYAEITIVPTSTLMVTIIGQDMKDTQTVKKYAEKIDWDYLEANFP